MSELKVRIHNGDRMRKVEKDSQLSNRRNRPKAYYKQFTYLKIPKIMERFGYNHQTESKALQSIQSSFLSKCELYFNRKRRVVKLGRMDKIKLKEQIDFEFKDNPLINFFNSLHKKIVKPILAEALEKIAKVNEDQPYYQY